MPGYVLARATLITPAFGISRARHVFFFFFLTTPQLPRRSNFRSIFHRVTAFIRRKNSVSFRYWFDVIFIAKSITVHSGRVPYFYFFSLPTVIFYRQILLLAICNENCNRPLFCDTFHIIVFEAEIAVHYGQGYCKNEDFCK